MPILEKISSVQNSKVKDIARLHRSRERRDNGLAIIEGLREILLALESGLETVHVMVCPQLFDSTNIAIVDKLIAGNPCYEVSKQVFAKMAYREQSDGLLAVVRVKEPSLSRISLSANPLIVVLESVEKPGNLGAILRTADAAGVDAVIVCDPLTDVYNPNVIRSSLGSIFTKQIAVCSSHEALQWLRKNGIEPVAAALTTSHHHFLADFSIPVAFIMGSEAEGLTDFWLRNTKVQVKIPMHGKIDSLNVSTSTAILLYEAVRQRMRAI